ncbi:hypothetical protein NITLEN_30140 [Nitrospira lenta]|uniref:Uncharacterized protein n=2 Tax=Nitrospira lenta TaxID=1436998 RepID=A0A330L8B8_9BACT|nr:hypothetical protein NITLEN_30140 [Nitrospira lenta]
MGGFEGISQEVAQLSLGESHPMPIVSQAVAQAALEECLRNCAEGERVFKEKQATTTGRDPSQPWHPLFNPNPEELLEAHIRHKEGLEQKPFGELWGAVLAGVESGEYRSGKDIADKLGKPYSWVLRLLQVAVKQRRFTREQLRAYFRKQRIQHAGVTAQRSIRKPNRVTRDTFAEVFMAKDPALTFDLVVRLLRVGCWKCVGDFTTHFAQSKKWVQAFRRLLIRELVMSAQEWKACWSVGRRSRR